MLALQRRRGWWRRGWRRGFGSRLVWIGAGKGLVVKGLGEEGREEKGKGVKGVRLLLEGWVVGLRGLRSCVYIYMRISVTSSTHSDSLFWNAWSIVI